MKPEMSAPFLDEGRNARKGAISTMELKYLTFVQFNGFFKNAFGRRHILNGETGGIENSDVGGTEPAWLFVGNDLAQLRRHVHLRETPLGHGHVDFAGVRRLVPFVH